MNLILANFKQASQQSVNCLLKPLTSVQVHPSFLFYDSKLVLSVIEWPYNRVASCLGRILQFGFVVF